jgi:isopenicillin N synthase-like dioxygenase
MDRMGRASEVVMPEDGLLVLPSNAMMILSGGLIPATAHQVMAGPGVPMHAHRTTLASFFQPQPDYPMAIPGGRSLAEIKAGSFHMSDFFEEGLTYGTYSDRLLDYLLTRTAPSSSSSL